MEDMPVTGLSARGAKTTTAVGDGWQQGTVGGTHADPAPGVAAIRFWY